MNTEHSNNLSINLQNTIDKMKTVNKLIKNKVNLDDISDIPHSNGEKLEDNSTIRSINNMQNKHETTLNVSLANKISDAIPNNNKNISDNADRQINKLTENKVEGNLMVLSKFKLKEVENNKNINNNSLDTVSNSNNKNDVITLDDDVMDDIDLPETDNIKNMDTIKDRLKNIGSIEIFDNDEIM